MFDLNLYNNYIKPVIDEIINNESIISAYIVGSFTTKTMWKPGISDVDMILLSSENKHEKKEIDITEQCKNYIHENKLQYIYNYNKKELFVISYVIWNHKDFLNPNIWYKYIMYNEKEKSMIIEDQLLFSEVNKLVFGTDIGKIKVSPKSYREYLIKKYNDSYIPKRPKITLLTEIKKILISCRTFYFLWTGDYIYDNIILLNLYKNKYPNEICQILELAINTKENINNLLGTQEAISSSYLSITLRLTKNLKTLLKYLIDIDHKYCENNNEIKIDTKFIEVYG